MRPTFRIKDLVLMTAIVALAFGWSADRARFVLRAKRADERMIQLEKLKPLVDLHRRSHLEQRQRTWELGEVNRALEEENILLKYRMRFLTNPPNPRPLPSVLPSVRDSTFPDKHLIH